MIDQLPKDKKIIVFDGVCNLCNSFINKVIDNDKNDQFRFVSLQSETGSAILKYLGISIEKIDSIVLYQPGYAYYYKAEAALKIAKEMGGLYSVLQIFSILPNGLLNMLYDFVAKNRYRWFGKSDSCRVPTSEIANKFL